MNIKEFMGEQNVVSRWFVLRIGMIGVFIGVILAVMFMMMGLIKP